jgi:hypothetical protein
MPSSNAAQSTSDTHDENLGLLANGSSGSWDVSIDETISGEERWFAQIEGPSVCLYFELPFLEIIPKVIRFLTPVASQAGASPDLSGTKDELLISKPSEIPVLLVRDGEFQDRCFVIVGQIERPIVTCSLTSIDSRDVLEALRQAEEDLPRNTRTALNPDGSDVEHVPPPRSPRP